MFLVDGGDGVGQSPRFQPARIPRWHSGSLARDGVRRGSIRHAKKTARIRQRFVEAFFVQGEPLPVGMDSQVCQGFMDAEVSRRIRNVAILLEEPGRQAAATHPDRPRQLLRVFLSFVLVRKRL